MISPLLRMAKLNGICTTGGDGTGRFFARAFETAPDFAIWAFHADTPSIRCFTEQIIRASEACRAGGGIRFPWREEPMGVVVRHEVSP